MRGGEAESGPTHNRLNMSCPTAKKMTGSSKAATNNDNDNGNGNRRRAR